MKEYTIKNIQEQITGGNTLPDHMATNHFLCAIAMMMYNQEIRSKK